GGAGRGGARASCAGRTGRRAVIAGSSRADAAAEDLGGRTCEQLVFSGGLVQKFTPLRNAILRYLDLPHTVHPGDDAALDGLAVLAEQLPQ
ncbi:MAG: hypothetical protein ACKOW5_13075, partial [Actinomycetales bacterium]